MGKDLSEMTLEELWELFPIFLVAHDDRWKDCYNEIEKTLTGLLSDQPVVRINHIGSTAIQGIWAKNIVDVMVEIPQSVDMKDHNHFLAQKRCILAACAGGTGRGTQECLQQMERGLVHMGMRTYDRISVVRYNKDYILPAMYEAGRTYADRLETGFDMYY